MMTHAKSITISIEEAVARMVNVDCDKSFPLLEMTDAFREEAEVEYENAIIDHLSDDLLESMRLRMEICAARDVLAKNILIDLLREVENPETEITFSEKDSSEDKKLDLASVSFWAAAKYGIDISKNVTLHNNKERQFRWEDVVIKIYAEYRIGYSIKGGKFKSMSLRDIGLMGQRKNDPNKKGVILIILSEKKKFPHSSSPAPRDKTAMAYIRSSLKNLIGLSDDPFLPFNEHDGYKPRFILLDERRNADKRAKQRAQHDNFDEGMAYGQLEDFEQEDDEAGRWLRDEDNQ